jgi:hypothetical protein
VSLNQAGDVATICVLHDYVELATRCSEALKVPASAREAAANKSGQAQAGGKSTALQSTAQHSAAPVLDRHT